VAQNADQEKIIAAATAGMNPEQLATFLKTYEATAAKAAAATKKTPRY
jgi:hypothetical protein